MGDSNNTPQQVVGGNRSKTEIARFTSTTTWTCPQNVTNVDVWVCGGGGGGGAGEWSSRADYYGRCGYGGCGGECIMYRNIDVTPNQSYNVVIGVGGAGGTKAPAAGEYGGYGGNGGQSYFINTTYQARGGDGGSIYSHDKNYIGTGIGGEGGMGATKGRTYTMTSIAQYLGRPGGYSRMSYPDFREIPASGTLQSNSVDSYILLFSDKFSVEEGELSKYGNTYLNGLNPYDGYHYGIGGTGATNDYFTSRSYIDPYLTTWSGNMHGGYANRDLYTNSQAQDIDGSVTCGGGGSTGGNLSNYPHAGGNGGSGLIIIYG